MSLKVDWHGVYPAVPTQFHDDFSLDLKSTQKHVEAILEEGIHGLIMLGTIGENCSLSLDEKVKVLKATKEVCGDSVPLLNGIAEFTTAGACETAKAAAGAGVDGFMLMPGMVYNSDRRETVNHFRTVAAATDLPIMCYNNPPVYRVDITPEMFEDLADVETIVCIKEAAGDTRRITDLFNKLGDRYLIFSGLDDVALESIMLGCVGWISGLVDAFPRENRLMWDAAEAGDWKTRPSISIAGTCPCCTSTHTRNSSSISNSPVPKWATEPETVRAPAHAAGGRAARRSTQDHPGLRSDAAFLDNYFTEVL